MFVNLVQLRSHTLHKNVAAAEIPGRFVDNFPCTQCVGCIALYQHTFSASLSKESQGFFGFILVGQVVDRDSLHAFLCQLYSDRTAEPTRAARDERGVERYFHGANPSECAGCYCNPAPTTPDSAIPARSPPAGRESRLAESVSALYPAAELNITFGRVSKSPADGVRNTITAARNTK